MPRVVPDCVFMSIIQFDALAKEIEQVRSSSANPHVGIYASGHLLCRPTRQEAAEYYRYIVQDMGDWEAAEHAAHIRTKGRPTPFKELKELKERMISGSSAPTPSSAVMTRWRRPSNA